MTVVFEGLITPSTVFGKGIHRRGDMVIGGVIPGVGRLARLEIGVGVGRSTADHRMVGGKGAGAVGLDGRLRQQVTQRVIRQRYDLVDLV